MELLVLHKVGDSNSVRQQMRFQVVAKKRNQHMQIIKWPDLESLDDGSLDVKMILTVDVSASTDLHQDKYTTYM